MPESPYSEALKEAFALAPKGLVYLETISISHPSLGADTIYLVKDTKDHTAFLESGASVLFKKAGFRVQRPPVGDNGTQEMALAFDNADKRISNFCKRAKEYQNPVTVTFRPYLSTDLSGPQQNPPLSLSLTDIVVTDVEVTGKCTFTDVINKSFPTERYTRARFPGLAND